MKKNFNTSVKKLAFSGLFLGIALVLPFLTGQIPAIGSALSPMHIPVLLCGFICGWQWGAAVGLAAPLFRMVLFGMPPLWTAIAMSFELAAYGLATGILYKHLPKEIPFVYVNLIISMIFGRLVWGAVKFVIAGFQKTEFPFSAFWAGAVANAVPGIICHIIVVPIIVIALQKAKLILNE